MTVTDESSETFEKANFPSPEEETKDQKVMDAAKKNSGAGVPQPTLRPGAAGKIAENAQAKSTGVTEPKDPNKESERGQANSSFAQTGQIKVKSPGTPKEGMTNRLSQKDRNDAGALLTPPAPNPNGAPKQDQQPEAPRFDSQKVVDAAKKNQQPEGIADRVKEKAGQLRDKVSGTLPAQKEPEEQPKSEEPKDQNPENPQPESAEDAYNSFLDDITDDEWTYTKKMLGDVGVAALDATANLGEALEKQYGALTALASTALSGRPMSMASQALTSTMTGMAAMNSFVDKTAQQSLGVKPGVDPEKLKDQLTIKGAGWYRDRDRAAAAEKYVTTRFDQAIKDVVGPDGDYSNIDDGQLWAIDQRMRQDMDPIMKRILSKPENTWSMEERAFSNAYKAMNRGVGKMTKQAGANARIQQKAQRQQMQDLRQQQKDVKAQLDDPQVMWQGYQDGTLPLEMHKQMYNRLIDLYKTGRELTPEQRKFLEDYRIKETERAKLTGDQARQAKTRTDFSLTEIREKGRNALKSLKSAVSEGRPLTPADIRAMNGYLDEINAYNSSYLGRSQPLDTEEMELYNAIKAFANENTPENAQRLLEMTELAPYKPPKRANVPPKTQKSGENPSEIPDFSGKSVGDVINWALSTRKDPNADPEARKLAEDTLQKLLNYEAIGQDAVKETENTPIQATGAPGSEEIAQNPPVTPETSAETPAETPVNPPVTPESPKYSPEMQGYISDAAGLFGDEKATLNLKDYGLKNGNLKPRGASDSHLQLSTLNTRLNSVNNWIDIAKADIKRYSELADKLEAGGYTSSPGGEDYVNRLRQHVEGINERLRTARAAQAKLKKELEGRTTGFDQQYSEAMNTVANQMMNRKKKLKGWDVLTPKDYLNWANSIQDQNSPEGRFVDSMSAYLNNASKDVYDKYYPEVMEAVRDPEKMKEFWLNNVVNKNLIDERAGKYKEMEDRLRKDVLNMMDEYIPGFGSPRKMLEDNRYRPMDDGSDWAQKRKRFINDLSKKTDNMSTGVEGLAHPMAVLHNEKVLDYGKLFDAVYPKPTVIEDVSGTGEQTESGDADGDTPAEDGSEEQETPLDEELVSEISNLMDANTGDIMDIDEWARQLMNSQAGRKYEDEIDLANAIFDIVGYLERHPKEPLKKSQSIRKSMPSIQDVFDNEFEL